MTFSVKSSVKVSINSPEVSGKKRVTELFCYSFFAAYLREIYINFYGRFYRKCHQNPSTKFFRGSLLADRQTH